RHWNSPTTRGVSSRSTGTTRSTGLARCGATSPTNWRPESDVPFSRVSFVLARRSGSRCATMTSASASRPPANTRGASRRHDKVDRSVGGVVEARSVAMADAVENRTQLLGVRTAGVLESHPPRLQGHDVETDQRAGAAIDRGEVHQTQVV